VLHDWESSWACEVCARVQRPGPLSGPGKSVLRLNIAQRHTAARFQMQHDADCMCRSLGIAPARGIDRLLAQEGGG
jgi:hypothetical protein